MFLVIETSYEAFWFSFKGLRGNSSKELPFSLGCSVLTEMALLRAVFTLLLPLASPFIPGKSAHFQFVRIFLQDLKW